MSGLKLARSSDKVASSATEERHTSHEKLDRLTHNIMTAFSGCPKPATAPINTSSKATTLTVSWNWRNFLMLSYTALPHMMAFTIEPNLSSKITTSEVVR